MSFAREADVACPRIFKRLQVMKPSPLGENKFGDGDSCGMHGLRFSAPPDGDGHLPNGHPGAPVRHTAALLAGRLAPLPDLATMQPPCHELDSSSMICWLAYNTCVCVWIAGVDSVRTITADSFEFLPRVCYSQCSVGTSPWPWVRIAATHSGQGTPIEPTVPRARPPRAPLPASTKWIPASKCLVTVRFGLVSD